MSRGQNFAPDATGVHPPDLVWVRSSHDEETYRSEVSRPFVSRAVRTVPPAVFVALVFLNTVSYVTGVTGYRGGGWVKMFGETACAAAIFVAAVFLLYGVEWVEHKLCLNRPTRFTMTVELLTAQSGSHRKTFDKTRMRLSRWKLRRISGFDVLELSVRFRQGLRAFEHPVEMVVDVPRDLETRSVLFKWLGLEDPAKSHITAESGTGTTSFGDGDGLMPLDL